MILTDIEELAKQNSNFRKVICTGENSQVVLMSIPAEEDIGEEIHQKNDQILIIVEGNAEAVLSGVTTPVTVHDVIFVPKGVLHNIINKGDIDLKLYTIYAPPAHKDGVIHATKEDAVEEEAY